MPEHWGLRKRAYRIVSHNPTSYLLGPLACWFAHRARCLNTLCEQFSVRECEQEKSEYAKEPAVSKHWFSTFQSGRLTIVE
jgi:hypothetical protein